MSVERVDHGRMLSVTTAALLVAVSVSSQRLRRAGGSRRTQGRGRGAAGRHR